MYYIYFPYAFLLSVILLVEFIEKEKPKLWALVIFFAPITAPYYIFQTKKEEGITWIMIFLASFSAVVAGEAFLYNFEKERLKYNDQPPIVRQALVFADELKKTTKDFDLKILELEQMSRIVSGLDKIKETIEYISIVRSTGEKNEAMLSKLMNYIDNYQSYFAKKNIQWVFQIKKYYQNEEVLLHLASLNEYLDSFEDVLMFSYKNFYKIVELEDSKTLRNYDAYYLKYRRATEKFSKYNLRRTEYQNEFVMANPKVSAYLPGIRQTDIFDIQRQSSNRFF